METLTLDKDIEVIYVTAKSFPDGIMESHKSLHALIPFSTDRKYFGISRPENGEIVYRAAAEAMPGEAEKLNCETMAIKRGKYIFLLVHNFMEDMQSIGSSFKKLLSHPGLDPNGFCIEWYLNREDVKCMIRLDDTSSSDPVKTG